MKIFNQFFGLKEYISEFLNVIVKNGYRISGFDWCFIYFTIYIFIWKPYEPDLLKVCQDFIKN
jgi:hypothetical protein